MSKTETIQKEKRATGYKLRPLELFEFGYCEDCRHKEHCIIEHKKLCVTLALVAALDAMRRR